MLQGVAEWQVMTTFMFSSSPIWVTLNLLKQETASPVAVDIAGLQLSDVRLVRAQTENEEPLTVDVTPFPRETHASLRP